MTISTKKYKHSEVGGNMHKLRSVLRIKMLTKRLMMLGETTQQHQLVLSDQSPG
jgi:hypothetical protein